MTELAFKNAAMLRLLADPAGPDRLIDLANALNRDRANTLRALKGLRAEGLAHPDKLALTAKGKRVLDGIDVAEGRVNASALTAQAQNDPALSSLPIWPLDLTIPNPANRAVNPEAIPGMADSLVENGQLQPITLTPVRADGTRMLLIGERRWRGAVMAREQGRDIHGCSGGLRFEEREATEAEAVGIMIVENVERQEIAPLDLALHLARYAELNGADGKPLTGVEVAERLGLGLRDVQVKLQIARKATPEAIADYREHGSWDRLLDTTRAPKAEPAEMPDYLDPAKAPNSYQWEQRGGKGDIPAVLIRREDPDRPNVGELIKPGDHVRTSYGTGPFKVEQARAASDAGAASWSLILRGYRDGRPESNNSYINGIVADWSAGAPRFLMLFKANQDEVFLTDAPSSATPAPSDPLVVNGIRFPNAARATEAKRLAGLIPNPSNSGGKSLKAVLQDLATSDDVERSSATPASADADTPPYLALPLPVTGLARLALVEIAHKTGEQRRPLDPVNPAEWTGDPHSDFIAFGCTCGAHWLDAPVQSLIADQLVEVVLIPGGHAPMLSLTGKAVGCFMRGQDELPALPVADIELDSAQIIGIGHADWMAHRTGEYVTDCLRTEAAAASPPPPTGAADADPVDLWDRDAETIAADDALLERVKAFADPDRQARPGDDALTLLRALGADPVAEVTDHGNLFLGTPDGMAELITVDARRTLPDSRAAALAWLIAWAIETAIGGRADA